MEKTTRVKNIPIKTRKEIIKKYESGMSLNQVGDIFHVSAYMVKIALKSEGKKVRTSAESCRINVRPLPEDWLDMARLQAQGLTYEKIADLNYCSVSCVKNRLRRIRERGIRV